MNISSFAKSTYAGGSSSKSIYAGNLLMMRRPALKSTQDKLERQQKAQNQVDFFNGQKEKLKDMQCNTLEEIARKLEMFHAYEEQIAAVKKQYNSEQMFHVLDEARELGEKIAEAAEKNAPKTPEERKEDMVEEALGIDESKGMLDEMLEEAAQLQDELLEEMEQLQDGLVEGTAQLQNEVIEEEEAAEVKLDAVSVEEETIEECIEENIEDAFAETVTDNFTEKMELKQMETEQLEAEELAERIAAQTEENPYDAEKLARESELKKLYKPVDIFI